MKFTDKSFIKNRLIPGIVFLLVTLIVLTLVILFNNPNILSVDNTFKTIIKILCFAVFAAFGGFIFYEFISSFHLKKIESIFLAILMLITLIFPFHYFMIGIVHNISSNDMEFIKMENVAFVVVTDYYSILIWIFTSLCFFVMKIFSVDNPDYRSILLKSFIFLAVSYLLMISSKILIYSVYSEYQYFILFVVVSFVTDTGGYIGGSLFGGKIIKKKLAPKISPKKTWEGAIVGFVLSAIVISILIYSLGLFQLHDTTKLSAKIIQNFFRILLVIFLPVAAIIGDLIFSCIKRLNNIKDFSKILRGHGGFLDRFDSLSLITFVGFTILLLI
ncbi:phosphatidate cytidylyltransferase [Mycoplasmopsis anatis]|uniref:Phosphatidate cytidylyltransferase n=1 Tax=Mycoplasmopsis anatis 1340 TaxID=1034808 RepID=F9QDW3_9BACT|nr:phosphatidate cytidylyltransferase [Mycoplasmopsis anatis]AWX70138.1 phosphatidate cytidylyltransferase [Mycoplasmopsis anatis]EGS29062.1 phosphatidate cytidylyltransferase [Mycoplasmopsis anatis 1340]VEU73420.1 Phosphatidate cytidylyltransferase [Mycoplasmopsis anatis]